MIASTSFRPTLLMPFAYQNLLSATDRIRFNVVTYSSAEEAWCAAESKPVDVFVSQQLSNNYADFSVILGILVLQSSAAHVHIFDSTEHVVALVNKSSLIRLIPSHDADDQLVLLCVEMAQMLYDQQAAANDMQRLREENEQYEFMLRQSLLS